MVEEGGLFSDWPPSSAAKRVAFINDLLFETPGGTRFTQDSPILPNIWLAYAAAPRSQLELILNVDYQNNAGLTAANLAERLVAFRDDNPPPMEPESKGNEDPIEYDEAGGPAETEMKGAGRRPARISFIPGQIATKLYFDELIRLVLPTTTWWRDLIRTLRTLHESYRPKVTESPEDIERIRAWIEIVWRQFPFPSNGPSTARPEDDIVLTTELGRYLLRLLLVMRREFLPSDLQDRVDPGIAPEYGEAVSRRTELVQVPDELGWFVRIAGWIGYCAKTGVAMLSNEDSIGRMLWGEFKLRNVDRIEKWPDRIERFAAYEKNTEEIVESRRRMVEGFFWLFEGYSETERSNSLFPVHRVNKNRRVHLAIRESTLTVKADAARHLFNVDCSGITWAIIDSGIDRHHPAFKNTTKEHEFETRRRMQKDKNDKRADPPDGAKDEYEDILPVSELGSRVIKTLDFTHLRELFEIDLGIHGDKTESQKSRLHARIAANLSERRRDGVDIPIDAKEVTDKVDQFFKDITAGRLVGWQELEDFIVDPNPVTPDNDHGTHVAGILAADWIEDIDTERKLPLSVRSRRMRGVCPDINLIDVRVFREDGLTDEFELMAAMQFLRWMNSRAGYMQVHGANLSLSLVHEVRRFACGQTPICVECNESSAAGLFIVAAAGNRGFDYEDAEEVRPSDGYRTVSVTDPGNAESVITVGATHRKRPHEYGVSYFSSRGPTGDGRVKPDVVAPGEKIESCVLEELSGIKDGTSMAAPHVSGVAAMLMARHSELIANPARVKKIICETATDLGRERYFQGHGLVDALRALQSV